MKKIIVGIGILILATLVACGGSVDTDALVDQAANAAKDGLDAAQDAVQEVADDAQDAIESAVTDATGDQLSIGDVVGSYTFEAPDNDWHYVEIVEDGDLLVWINRADASWTLTPDLENNLLLTDDSFPYQADFQNFEILVEGGEYIGLLSNGDLWLYDGAGNGNGSAAAEGSRWAGSIANGAAGVMIDINGVTAESDGSGNFELSVPEVADGRYVINADQDGYLPVSQIHIGAPLESMTIEFKPVEQFVVDPTQGIDQEDSMGTQIVIEPDSLVDENGNLPEGDVVMEMYTYDLTSEEMVGDMSGTNSDGELVSMESAGAFHASFEDETGTEYNLADGATAEISIPAERQQPDEVLTVWSYNEETGLWEEEGVAALEDGRYVAEVSHFSYWNFDWEKREPACVKLDIDPGYLAANSPLKVRAVLQTNPVAVRDLHITDPVNVLINLPANTDVKFYMTPDFSAPFATTSSGTPWGGVGTPAYPYNACNGVTEIVPVPAVTTGSITGQVTNAVTGEAIPNVQVCIQGTPKCVDTDANGNYTIADVAPGEQLLNVREDGFIPVNDQTATVVAGETANRPIAMSPELAVGELRIVLSWSENPSDIDSYLWLPDATSIDYNVKGQTIQDTVLDLDDKDGSGPETITIMKQQDGTYTYAVHNYARSNKGEATTIPEAGAVVRVYQGDREIKSYSAPASGNGDWWHVFDLDGSSGMITDVNKIVANSPK